MPSDIQAIYFRTTDGWTAATARAWLRAHEFKPIKRMHHLGTELRYRLRDPRQFRRFITKKEAGVYYVIGFY